MLPLGIVVAVLYWLLESALHTFVFHNGPLSATLLCEHDPNELWMRILISLLFIGFGIIADRMIAQERRRKEDAERVGRLLHFMSDVQRTIEHPSDETLKSTIARISDIEVSHDDLDSLTILLQEMTSFLELRFKELYALLQLTHEINKGLLLDDILDKAYETLQSVIPYERLGVALLDADGRAVRSRWVRSDRPDEILLGLGYSGSIRGSSLRWIIRSGEPRIINDLTEYLKAHPYSDSTRLMVAEGIRSSLTCPLIVMGKPIGFIFFSSRRSDVYRNVHVDMFKLIAGHLAVVVEKSTMYQQILDEKRVSESLLLNVMPARIAERLRAGEETIGEELPRVSILFADVVGFTSFASRVEPDAVVQLLRDIFVRFDRLCDQYGVEKIKTVGDEYMAMIDGRAISRLAEYSLEMQRVVEEIRYPDGSPVRMRIGIHTGPVIAGVIGQKKFAYDIWGDTVNVASRMEATGEAGRIQVTEEVVEELRHDFVFETRGEILVKGKGTMRTFFLVARKSVEAPALVEV